LKAVSRPTPEVTRLSAKRNVSLRFYVRELWSRRDLIPVLSGRELKSTYEMNLVGFAWWLLEPLSLTLVYVVIVDLIFNRGEPAYPLFVIAALLPYKWLVAATAGAMGTVRQNASLVTDVYFPRALLPVVTIMTGMAHFGVGLLVIPIFMAVYHVVPTWHLLWLPVIVAVQFLFILGLAYPMSVWGLNYRNLPGLVANLMRLWFYLSPGIWSLSRVKVPWHRTIIHLNPLTGLFLSYRGAIGILPVDSCRTAAKCPLHATSPGWDLAYTAGVGLVILVLGAMYFIRRESTFGKEL
jgi:ABC-type polysaccharide/polyol phosphate export permease